MRCRECFLSAISIIERLESFSLKDFQDISLINKILKYCHKHFYFYSDRIKQSYLNLS